jgi:aspartyl-tRNA synthetase
MQRILSIETPKFIGKKVKLSGWVDSRRDHGKIIFIDLRDKSGLCQIVFTPSRKPEAESQKHVLSQNKISDTGSKVEVYESAQKLRPEWVISIIGTVKERPKGMENPKIPLGKIEISVEELEILSEAETPPFEISEEEAEEVSLEKRLNWRWVDLRRPEKQLIFQVWTAMEQAFVNYWLENKYIQIHSPKFMNAASESGAELFEVIYFDRKAYLAQSPQFYKQMAMAAGFEKIFEIGPVFRAEPSFTPRHATEYIGYDAEISFIDSYQDVIQEEEKLLVAVLTEIKNKFGEEILKFYKRDLIIPEIPFPQITIKEAKKVLKKMNVPSKKPGDISPEEEKKICEFIKKEKGHEFVFITEYPIDERPFYHMRSESDSKITDGFDLLWNGIEITTGSQREHRYDILIKQAEEKGINIKSIQHYFDFFKFGCPPHGGLGIGPARMIMKIFNLDNIREATFLHRGVKRLTP